ncbi:hypothetical protein [Paenibacillus xylanilyticus]|uniref:Uncharacterized protein n=1 Tax=Paenibacillus xylanilyticus TaxID=248903 RepID=A0A7Y6EVD2_9BACL|nr:hypothetical protein [Paenibacillus xylanilyticus]NUU75295.1 hypothetical protein [Paenibacillus xylanilyticus]
MTEVKITRKRRKKKRKALWITLITLLILAGSGWGGFHYLTHKDVQAEDVGVDQDFFDFSNFDLESNIPPVSNNGKEEEKSPSKVASGNSSSDGPSTNTNNTNVENTTKPESGDAEQEQNTDPKDIAQEIENKYSATFKSLEVVATTKLNTLAENALKDYRSGRSLTDLSSTYMSASNKLQNKVDSTFYKLLDEMKAELKANELNNDLAQKAESTYTQAIAAKKSEMLDKVLQFK